MADTQQLTPDDVQKLLAAESGVETQKLTPQQVAEVTGEPPPVPPPPEGVDPGLWRSILLQFGSGGLKQGLDEVAGEIVQHAPGTIGRTGTYRKARDGVRAELDAAQENHPVPSFLANMAGDIGSDYVLSAFGVPVTNTAYQTAVGGLSGLLGSKSELTTDKRTAADDVRAAVDTGTGAGLAYLAPKIGQGVARLGAPLLRKARAGLEGVAAYTGRRVLQGGSDMAAARFEEVPAEAILDAIRSGGILPFGTTNGALKRLEGKVADRAAIYDSIVKELEDMGFKGPEVAPLVDQLMKRAEEEAFTVGSKAPARVVRGAAEELKNIARGGNALERVAGPEVSHLGLTEGELLKRRLQGEAKYGLLSDTPVNEAKKAVAHDVRQAVEESVEQQAAQFPADSAESTAAASFAPAKESLGRAIAARDLAKKGAARIAGRNAVGLREALMGTLMSGGLTAAGEDPVSSLVKGAGTAALLSVAKNRLPSAGASTAYWLGQGAKAGADTLSRHAPAVSAAGRFAGQYAGRNPATIQALTDWLAGSKPKSETEALLEYLQQQK